MKKNIFLSFVMMLLTTVSRAQLLVNMDQKVGIGTETEYFQPILMVGDHGLFADTCYNIGIGASPDVANKNNIGAEGCINANSSFTSDKNFGVLGVIYNMNNTHGRNYGVCGAVSPGAGNAYGGAGIYATCYTYYYSVPTNLQSVYAGFFAGVVGISSDLTASSLFTTSDSRLSDNIISLSGTRESGKSTLENLLSMDVIEYNLKPRLKEVIPEDVSPEKTEELRKELEYLKQEEQKMTARRHFGIDAREVQQVYPDLVLEGEDGCLAVNYLEMVPLVIRSIQELKQELDEVKKAGAEYTE